MNYDEKSIKEALNGCQTIADLEELELTKDDVETLITVIENFKVYFDLTMRDNFILVWLRGIKERGDSE